MLAGIVRLCNAQRPVDVIQMVYADDEDHICKAFGASKNRVVLKELQQP